LKNAISWQFPVWAGVSLILILAVGNLMFWQQTNTLKQENTDFHMIVQPLSPAGETNEATGILVIDPNGLFGTIIVDAIAPSGDKDQYQIWLSRDDVIETGGAFTVPETGYRAKEILAPRPLNWYTRIWITVEPQPSGQYPTGQTVLQSSP
jgi:hypothetical protein